jgi:rSAM/selenodomain-associated transferase 1
MARRLVGIMAKAPLAGYAKTRLIPVLGATQAALLQQHMLLDTIELVSTALCGDGTITLVCPTTADRVELERIVPDGLGVVAHERVDLMSGLDYALSHHLAHGYEQVVLLDGDSPTLPGQYIQSGFDHLREDAVVLGPTLDGGYYLIGACRPRSQLFDWQRLDSATICQQTRARAEALGATVHMLPSWYDVDTAEDLERLCAELQRYPNRAPRTFRFLEANNRQ